jgi:hypothetical protein
MLQYWGRHLHPDGTGKFDSGEYDHMAKKLAQEPFVKEKRGKGTGL